MSLLFILAKTFLILFFLVMFLRTNKVAWGIGLLTVTSAILLDTFLGTLGREQMKEELGFFFYITAGALFAGATFWLWVILKDFVLKSNTPIEITDISEPTQKIPDIANNHSNEEAGHDRQNAERLHLQLNYDQLLDLMFDIGWFGEDLDRLQGDNEQFIQGIVTLAEARGQLESLQLASERIVTPIPADHLPRLEKLKADSPPTLLRQFLTANYSVAEIEQLIDALGIDSNGSARKVKNGIVREFLSDLYQNNRMGELINHMQQSSDGE